MLMRQLASTARCIEARGGTAGEARASQRRGRTGSAPADAAASLLLDGDAAVLEPRLSVKFVKEYF
jgi:hypothetical protein